MIHREALGGNLYRRTIEDRTFHFLKHIAEMSSSPELPKMKACMAASGWTRLYLEVWQSWPSTILVKVLNSDPTKSLCRHVVGTTGQHILFEPEDYCSWRTGHQTIWSICQTQCICRIKCSRLGKYEGFSIPCSWDILRLKHTKKKHTKKHENNIYNTSTHHKMLSNVEAVHIFQSSAKALADDIPYGGHNVFRCFQCHYW